MPFQKALPASLNQIGVVKDTTRGESGGWTRGR